MSGLAIHDHPTPSTYRTALGWSQEKLAVRAGLSLNFIGNLERGKVNVSVETLERLSRPLGVQTEMLLKNLERVILSTL